MSESLTSPASGYDKSLKDYKVDIYKKENLGKLFDKLQADPKLEAAARLVMFNAALERGENPLLKGSESEARYQDRQEKFRQTYPDSIRIWDSPEERKDRARKAQMVAAGLMARELVQQKGGDVRDMPVVKIKDGVREYSISTGPEFSEIMDVVDALTDYEDAVPDPASYDYEAAAAQFELPLTTPEQGFDALRASQAVPVGALALGTTVAYP